MKDGIFVLLTERQADEVLAMFATKQRKAAHALTFPLDDAAAEALKERIAEYQATTRQLAAGISSLHRSQP